MDKGMNQTPEKQKAEMEASCKKAEALFDAEKYNKAFPLLNWETLMRSKRLKGLGANGRIMIEKESSIRYCA